MFFPVVTIFSIVAFPKGPTDSVCIKEDCMGRPLWMSKCLIAVLLNSALLNTPKLDNKIVVHAKAIRFNFMIYKTTSGIYYYCDEQTH